MKIIRIIITLFFGFTQAGFGQWIHYNLYNTKGIPGTMVSSGLVARNDLLWFGTDQGVTCFNSETAIWTTYNTSSGIKSNFIYQVFEDKNGYIWAATNGAGISRFANNLWTHFTMDEGLSYNVVRAISQSPDGTMWFGTYGHGICSYTPDAGFKKYTSGEISNSYVLSLLALSDDLILIGTLNEGLLVLENDTVRRLENEQELTGKKVFSIFRDHGANVWIGTDKGAQQYNSATRMVSSCVDSLSGKAVYAMCENQAQDLIFATSNKIYTLADGAWSSFVPGNLVNSTSFYSALYDKEGSGWFGSSNQGLFRKNGPTWYNYYNSTGLTSNYLTSLCEDREHNLWFSSYGDLYRFDGQNWRNVTQNEGFGEDYYGKILTDLKGNIWCTANNGIYKYDGNTWTNYSHAVYFDNGYITSLILDKEGSVWAGTGYHGAYRFDSTKWTRFTTDQGLATNSIKAMAVYPDGKLAVVSEYAQISIYDGNSWSVDLSLVGEHYITDMAIDSESNIWLATYNGIISYKDLESRHYYDDTNDGYNYVAFINAEKDGQVWAGLYYTGLIVFNGANWYTFTTSDGLSSYYLKDMLIDSRGRYWIIADNGINMSATFTNIKEPGSNPVQNILIYPNPFAESFDLQYTSQNAGYADIHFFTADGRLIKQYNQQKIEVGENLFHFESNNWPEGLLFCKIMRTGSTENIKLLKISTH